MTTRSSATLPAERDLANSGSAKSLAVAGWLLRIGVFVHALTLFAVVFSTRQTQFGNLLFLEAFITYDDPYLTAVFVEKITVSLYLAAGVVVLLRPFSPVLLFMMVYAFTEAASGAFNGGSRFSDWVIPAHALRFSLPLVLLVLVVAPGCSWLQRWRVPVAATLLRLAVATVFFTHGYEALMEHPRFIDLIIGSFRNLFDTSVSEVSAVGILKGIAVVDFIVAVAVLIYPPPLFVQQKLVREENRKLFVRFLPPLMLWLAFWGGLTALSRMTALGFSEGMSEYVEASIRISHIVGPLALWFLFSAMYRPEGETAGNDSAEGELEALKEQRV